MSNRKPTPTQIARGLVVSLIKWETGSADGDSYFAACMIYGPDVMDAAMGAVRRGLERQGVAWMTDEQITKAHQS